LLDDTTSLELSHDLQRLPCDIDQAEEVDVHLLPELAVGERLEWSTQTVASVVHDNVDALELLDCSFESFVDRALVSHIEIDHQAVGVIGVVELQLRAVASCCNDMIAVLEYNLDELLSEASGCASDEKDAGCHFVIVNGVLGTRAGAMDSCSALYDRNIQDPLLRHSGPAIGVISVAIGIKHVTEIRGHPRLHGIAADVSFNAVFTMRPPVSRLCCSGRMGIHNVHRQDCS
jgi:hypothetical protein